MLTGNHLKIIDLPPHGMVFHGLTQLYRFIHRLMILLATSFSIQITLTTAVCERLLTPVTVTPRCPSLTKASRSAQPWKLPGQARDILMGVTQLFDGSQGHASS